MAFGMLWSNLDIVKMFKQKLFQDSVTQNKSHKLGSYTSEALKCTKNLLNYCNIPINVFIHTSLTQITISFFFPQFKNRWLSSLSIERIQWNCKLRIYTFHSQVYTYYYIEAKPNYVYKTSALDFHFELHFIVESMGLEPIKSSREQLRHNGCVQLLYKIVSLHKKQQWFR